MIFFGSRKPKARRESGYVPLTEVLKAFILDSSWFLQSHRTKTYCKQNEYSSKEFTGRQVLEKGGNLWTKADIHHTFQVFAQASCQPSEALVNPPQEDDGLGCEVPGAQPSLERQMEALTMEEMETRLRSFGKEPREVKPEEFFILGFKEGPGGVSRGFKRLAGLWDVNRVVSLGFWSSKCQGWC